MDGSKEMLEKRRAFWVRMFFMMKKKFNGDGPKNLRRIGMNGGAREKFSMRYHGRAFLMFGKAI